MASPGFVFLGEMQRAHVVQGCTVALTSYSGKHDQEDWHSHEHASISLLINGTHGEELSGRRHIRRPGQLKFIPAGEAHRCEGYVPGTIKINLDLTPDLLLSAGLTEDELDDLIPASMTAKFGLLKLYHELEDGGGYVNTSGQMLLLSLLRPPAKRAKNLPAWALQLRALLQDEWNSAIDLQELSHRLGVHPVTISRYFPHYFSATLGDHMRQIKVDRALSFIKETKWSLTEIAYKCGFADQAHFTRTFKTVTGYLPKDFRNI
jgi:AraC family transcriptional regulator